MSALEELRAIIYDTDGFDENGRMAVVSVLWSDTGLTVRLHVDHGTGEQSNWQFRFTGVVDYVIEEVYHCGLHVWNGDHPAIDQYTQPHESLHFASAAPDPYRLVGELWSAHVALVGDWIDFTRYLNTTGLPLHELLASRSGLFATGPRFLIDAYEEVLERAGCRPSRKKARRRRALESLTMTHFGGSRVVAEQVTARRLAR